MQQQVQYVQQPVMQQQVMAQPTQMYFRGYGQPQAIPTVAQCVGPSLPANPEMVQMVESFVAEKSAAPAPSPAAPPPAPVAVPIAPKPAKVKKQPKKKGCC